MTTLLNLTPTKRKELFISKIREFASEGEKDKRSYALGYRDGNYFFNLNLNELIFAANNEYELWLIVNEYLSKKLNYNDKKEVISLREMTDDGIILQSSYKEGEEDDTFNFYDDEDIIDTIHFLMEDDNNIKIKDVIDEVIEDFFKNDFFWAREVINADYISDSEDETEYDV